MRQIIYSIHRHSNANPSNNFPTDKERTLSETGQQKARNMKDRLGSNWHLVVSSEAVRAVQTARILSGLEPVTLPELYYGPDEQIIFARGLRPLCEYTSPVEIAALKAYGDRAADKIRQLTRQAVSGEHHECGHEFVRVLVVGHAVLAPAVARSLGGPRRIDELPFAECEGVSFNSHDDGHFVERLIR